MWFTTEERDTLRRQGLAQWRLAYDLRERAVAARLRAEALGVRADAALRRAELLCGRLAVVVAEGGGAGRGPGRSGDGVRRGEMVARAQEAIERWGPPWFGAKRIDNGIGLVACPEAGALVKIQEEVTAELDVVLGALDAGTALGMAVALQPDLAVIDAHLAPGDTVEVALTMASFAPRTRGLVLIEDTEPVDRLHRAGFDTMTPSAPDEAFAAWLRAAAA